MPPNCFPVSSPDAASACAPDAVVHDSPPVNDGPWLTLLGLHAGVTDLTAPALAALREAQVIFGSARHLALVGEALVTQGGRGELWPVPLKVDAVLALRGRAQVVVLASGDPFWHGVGTTLATHLRPGEWQSFAQPSTFSLMAAQLGWGLQSALCMGLHAADVAQLRPHLAPGRRCLLLVRDAQAVGKLAQWLAQHGWGRSRLWVMRNLGSAQAVCTQHQAQDWVGPVPTDGPPDPIASMAAPIAVALLAEGGPPVGNVPGRSEHGFIHDGQISKAPVRALTLAALRPWHDALLWDLGGGSGAVSVEWCLAGGRAECVERLSKRVANIRENARRFGVAARLRVHEGSNGHFLHAQTRPAPDAIFVGGGFDAALFSQLRPWVNAGARLVVNAVTLHTQALLLQLHAQLGGQLLKIDLAHAAPLGGGHGWQSSRTLVQWAYAHPGDSP